MCGISGFYRLWGDGSQFKLFNSYFEWINQRIVARGPDAFGIYAFEFQLGSFKKGTACVETTGDVAGWRTAYDTAFQRVTNPFVCLINFRGVPPTEDSDERQPFTDGKGTYVVHNGQLSNDQEISKVCKYPNLSGREKDVDSYLFIHLMNDVSQGAGKHTEWLNAIADVEGSYAMAGYSESTQGLYFARNFRGLHFATWEYEGDAYLVWSSEPDMSIADHRMMPGTHVSVMEMPPYSTLHINASPVRNSHLKTFNGNAEHYLHKLISSCKHLETRSEHNRKSCVVVFSGGLDSTVCAAWAADRYDEVHLLHFQYGARAEKKELEAARKVMGAIAEHYYRDENRPINRPAPVIGMQVIPLDFLKNLGGSTLTDHSQSIKTGEEAVETNSEWVPARNTLLIAMAASYCDRHDIGTIILGLNMQEGSVYPDNSIEYYREYEKALLLGTMSKPKLQMPLGNKMKHHIVEEGIRLKAPLELAWSCYTGDDVNCGVCGSCIQRRQAYAALGIKDPQDYRE